MLLLLNRAVAGIGDADALVEVDAAYGQNLINHGLADEAVAITDTTNLPAGEAAVAVDDAVRPRAVADPPPGNASKADLEAYVAANGIPVPDDAKVADLRKAIDDAVEQRGLVE